MAPNGTQFEIPVLSQYELTLGQIVYDYCRLNWCITDFQESNFVYEDGSSFQDYFRCDDPYPGIMDLSRASPALTALCGTNKACLTDGIELGIENAQILLYFEEERLRSPATSRFAVDPTSVQVRLSAEVSMSINLSEVTDDVSDIEEFRVYRVDAATGKIESVAFLTLGDV